jgi:alkanesulfonate monooxygenase SsuD/methylene tetrahydromethanopterin reductase-like flavin-dependent oxidoreductase (luciferase family)
MSQIKFGLVLPQGWRWLDASGSSPAAQYEFARDIVTLAELLGYDTVYAYDHLWGGANFRSNHDKSFFECFVFLSSFIGITSRIRFGQLVTCNSYRNPALLAKMISTMDVLSSGRIELGIGAGWSEDEYRAFGYSHSSPFERIQQLDEALTIIKLMFTRDESSFSGKHYSIVNATCSPRPVQEPYPPIMVGGTGEKYLLKTVARHANIYNHPFAPSTEVQRRLNILHEHCGSIGRNYKEIEPSIVLRLLIRETEDEIRDLILRVKNKHETVECFIRRVNAIVGTPEVIKRKIYEYVDLGIERFIIHFTALNKRSLELLHSNIMKNH